MEDIKDKEEFLNSEEITELTEIRESDLVPTGSLNIAGLEDVPASILPVPYLKLVQPTSQNIEIADGKEAETGSFYYTDTQDSKTVVRFALLKAKHGPAEFERDGEMVHTTKVAILGYDLDLDKLFITSLSPTSFSPFGQLIAKMKQAEIGKTWEYEVIMKSEKTQNDKGKYWIVKFELGKKLSDEEILTLSNLKDNYGSSLDQREKED